MRTIAIDRAERWLPLPERLVTLIVGQQRTVRRGRQHKVAFVPGGQPRKKESGAERNRVGLHQQPAEAASRGSEQRQPAAEARQQRQPAKAAAAEAASSRGSCSSGSEQRQRRHAPLLEHLLLDTSLLAAALFLDPPLVPRPPIRRRRLGRKRLRGRLPSSLLAPAVVEGIRFLHTPISASAHASRQQKERQE